tara:strand:- start:3 stop:536 length:534 start_codon:yes stop_codon:yes gene_type:complete
MAMTLITTNTSSGAATSSFTSSIDSTYKLYIFKYYDVNPATDNVSFSFQANASSQSGYNETMTTTTFRALHNEADDTAELSYAADDDQGQGTAFQGIALSIGNGADESASGELFLFNPSNTTYVKHFYGTSNVNRANDASQELFVAGYLNVTAAITNIQFKMSSGNFDGTIKMYGVG